MNLYGFVGNAPVNEIDVLGLTKQWKIFFTGASGNIPRYVDPFANTNKAVSNPSAAWRQQSAKMNISRSKNLTVTADLQATHSGGAVVKGEGYDFITVQGTPTAELISDRTKIKQGFGHAVMLKADSITEEIEVTTPNNSNPPTPGSSLPFNGPTLEDSFSVAGIAFINHATVVKKVKIEFRASAVYTIDASAYPANYGTYTTQYNNNFITWYSGGYQMNYAGQIALTTSKETPPISLTFEIRCID